MYVKLEHVTKKIRGNLILNDISLELKKGVIYGIRGKNGSGKTMLLKAMCGLIRLTEGTVTIDGKILGKDCDFPENAGALLENPGFIAGYNAENNLKALAAIRGKIEKQQIENILQEVGLGDPGKKKYRHFSLGMKQKLGIAAALMEEPELILLDEPTNALDQQSVEKLRTMLLCRKNNAVIVIASHDQEELSMLSDEIFAMENGCISSVNMDNMQERT